MDCFVLFRNNIRSTHRAKSLQQISRGNLYRIPFALKNGLDRQIMFDSREPKDYDLIKRMYISIMYPRDKELNPTEVKFKPSRLFLFQLQKGDETNIVLNSYEQRRNNLKNLPNDGITVRGKLYDTRSQYYSNFVKFQLNDYQLCAEHLGALQYKQTQFDAFDTKQNRELIDTVLKRKGHLENLITIVKQKALHLASKPIENIEQQPPPPPQPQPQVPPPLPPPPVSDENISSSFSDDDDEDDIQSTSLKRKK